MNTRLVDWDRFLDLAKLRNVFERVFVKKGFKSDEVHDVVFDLFFKVCCRKVTHVNYKWMYFDIWQMDGLKDCVPFSKSEVQLDLFSKALGEGEPILCKIKDWKNDEVITFHSIKVNWG